MKNTLVVNCGSTSTKYKFFNQKGEEKFSENFNIKNIKDKKKEEIFLRMIKKVSKNNELKIAFRVVHGGDLVGPVILKKETEKKIKNFTVFAPIHNKIVLKKINKLKKKFEKFYNENKFFAIFDTDFHKTMPKEFFTYPIDQKIVKKFHVRKYGFHGVAVSSALKIIEDGFLKRGKKIPEKIIFAHLGGGSSLTAVKNKKSIANTMGLTPISGLMMTTRVGDVDSDLDKILSQKMGKSIRIISDMLSRKSGFLALTGSSDIKNIFDKAQKEKKEKKGEFLKEEFAFDIYLNKLVEKISGYVGILGGVDLIVFSGGLGEGNSFLRKEVEKKLTFLKIQKENILAVKINEEKEIFEQVKNL